MCEQTQFSYQSGQVVWVKLSNCWWPGEALSCDELPEDVRTSFKKPPVTVVQFFEEEKYEYVRNYDQVCLYNCKRKHEFIQKGLEMLRKHKNENFMNKFPSDVIRAEELTNGDPNIIKKFETVPDERPDYNIIFGRNDKSPRRGRSPIKMKRNSLPAKQKMNFSVLLPENRAPFARRSDSALYQSKGEHTLYIRVQPGAKKNNDVDDTDANTSLVSVATSDHMYSCFMCNFKSTRIEGFMAHRKSHLSSTYGSAKPQLSSSKKSRKKSESTGSKKRSSSSSLPLERSQISANRKRLSYPSKSQNGKIETERVSKSELAKIFGSSSRRSRKEKSAVVKPINSETKSLQKPLSGKKKAPRKRKNDDVFKTLLADWDDEDPTLLQQEEEKIKKKCKASCFDFDDSADSMLDIELEERANRFARTRNIPIISKPDSSAKKQRLENLPSTSRDVRLSKKRPMEEIVRKNKRMKISADQDEEEYTKLILADAVPECVPHLSSLAMPCTENNNTVSDESDTIKVSATTVDRKTLPSTPCVPGVSDSFIDQEEDASVMKVSGVCNGDKHTERSSGQDELDIVFDDEQELLQSHVNESVLELTKCNTEPSGPMMTDHELLSDLQDDDVMPPSSDIPVKEQIPDSKTATNYIVSGVLEENPPSEVEAREGTFHEGESVASDSRDSAEAVPVEESEEACLSSVNNATGSCLNISSDVVAENIENASVYELRQDDDDDDDMPEIICLESCSSQKTTFLHGERNKESEDIRGIAKEEVSKVQKTQRDVKTASSSDEVIHLGNTHQVPEGLPSHNEELDGESMSDLVESSVHSRSIDGVCGDLDGAIIHHADNTVTWGDKESEEKCLEGESNEEVTIIGYKCGANADFKEIDDNIKEQHIVASRESSPEISLSCAEQESTESVSVDLHSAPGFNIADSELIKVLDDSTDDKKSENEEISAVDDSSSTKEEETFTAKAKRTPSSEVSREEIVADWSDDDEDNVAPVKEKIIEVIDLDKSESEDGDEEITANKTAVNQIASGIAEGVTEEEKGGDVMALKTVHITDEEMELDINSMPVVVEDAVIKDDGGSNFGCLPPSTSHISVVGTSAPGYPSPKTTAALPLSSSTSSLKTLANNIIVVTSQNRQLPLTARGVFTSPNSKVVIMPRAARGKKFTPILLANSSGITTRVFTEREQESLFREGKKTLLQRVKPKITIQTSKTKPLLPNIQTSGSILDTPSVIMPSKSVVVPGASLMSVASSSIPTSLKVDPTGVQGTVPKIVVRPGTSNIMLQKNVADLRAVSNLTAGSSGTGPEGLKRLTNIFPLVKGSGSGAKQLVITQPSTKLSASLQVFPKSQVQTLKKTRRMFTCQSPKTSPPLKSVPTTTIEISVSGVLTTQPAVTLAPTMQRGVNASSIPRIPSSTIPLPRTSVSTTSPIVVGNQDAPSFVFIVDPGNAHHYTTTSNILNYDSSCQSTPPQPVYLEPSSVSTSGNLDSMVITLDDSPSSAVTSSVFRLAENPGPSPMFVANGSSGQDILATALANTEVFQPEACLQDTLAVVSNEQSISEAAAVLPSLQGILPVANPSEVLETLTLKEPIMTPHEVPSCMTSIQIQSPAPVSLRASLAASPSMPLLTDDPVDHARSPTLELYENTSSQDTITIQTTLNEEPQLIFDDRR